MLSYRHAFHAGCHADVIKHLIQALILEALGKKAKPYCYIDTHAGGVLYDLASEEAQKTGEAEQGICKVIDHPLLPQSYRQVIVDYNPEGILDIYPGSPAVAQAFQREQDHLVLMELHNNEVANVKRETRYWNNTSVHHRDGFEGLPGILPPTPRRGLVLIDPSYEIKTDYTKTAKTVKQAHKRWATGIYAVWYPILVDDKSRILLEDLEQSGIRRILVAEISREAGADETFGMIGSGMLLVNPPYQLDEQLQEILPELAQAMLGPDAKASVRWLVKE